MTVASYTDNRQQGEGAMVRSWIGAAAVATLAFLFPSTSSAEEIYISALDSVGLIRGVQLQVDDTVTGNCWTNAAGLESKIRLMFEREGIAVYRDELYSHSPFFPLVRYYAHGQRSDEGYCIGGADYKVIYHDWGRWGGVGDIATKYRIGSVVYYAQGGFTVLHPDNLDGLISSNFEAATAELLGDIIAARRTPQVQRMLEDFAHYDRPYLQKDYEQDVSVGQ